MSAFIVMFLSVFLGAFLGTAIPRILDRRIMREHHFPKGTTKAEIKAWLDDRGWTLKGVVMPEELPEGWAAPYSVSETTFWNLISANILWDPYKSLGRKSYDVTEEELDEILRRCGLRKD